MTEQSLRSGLKDTLGMWRPREVRALPDNDQLLPYLRRSFRFTRADGSPVNKALKLLRVEDVGGAGGLYLLGTDASLAAVHNVKLNGLAHRNGIIAEIKAQTFQHTQYRVVFMYGYIKCAEHDEEPQRILDHKVKDAAGLYFDPYEPGKSILCIDISAFDKTTGDQPYGALVIHIAPGEAA